MNHVIWITGLIVIGIGILIMSLIVVLAVPVSLYVLQSIGLYRMAKKLGYDSPWLAWLPVVNLYLMFVLPKHSFEPLLIKQEIISRVNAFWIFIGTVFGSSIISSILSAFFDVPVLGIFFAIMVISLDLLMIFTIVIFQYPLYRDLFEMFFSKESADVCAIVGILFPMAVSVMFFLAGKREPHITDFQNKYLFLAEKNNNMLGGERK